MEKEIPRLRTDIEIIPTEYRGERVILVKDSLGLIPDPVLLRGEALEIVGLIDGKRDIREIQLELIRRKGGIFIRMEDIAGVLAELDGVFLMQSENYRQRKAGIIREFERLESRNPFLAGRSYPENPGQLTSYIRAILETGGETAGQIEEKKALALVAPHIDLKVGKKIYAEAYRSIRNRFPRRVLLLGTGHSLRESYLSLTTKNFITPWGKIETDKEWVEKLKNNSSPRAIAPYDIDHRNEHSLEFQLLFLHYLFGGGFTLIPVLCGSFHRMLQKVSRPEEIPEMKGFISGLRNLIEEENQSLLIVAGVDLSHIGLKFGHRRTSTSLLLEAKEHDRKLLEKMCEGDVRGFWAEVQKVDNAYNVCGFSAIAILLELLEGRKGRLLGYDFWSEVPTQSAVSFAATVFPFRP
jgi:AmmeMemoRadiSam system protein B